MLIYLPRIYDINCYLMFYVQNGPKLVMLYCSVSISTNEMAAFGVIQSHDIFGQMVKCFYVINSIRYYTDCMISRIPTMKTFKVD